MIKGERIGAKIGCAALLVSLSLSGDLVSGEPDPPKTYSVPDAVAAVLPSVVSIMTHGAARATPPGCCSREGQSGSRT